MPYYPTHPEAPSEPKRRARRWPWLFFVLIFGVAVWFLLRPHQTVAPVTSHVKKPAATQKAPFNKQQYSLTDPTSIWVIVNKQRPLSPANYAPTDLVTPTVPLRAASDPTMQMRQVAATALESMFAAAKTAGVPMMLSSGYRSYEYQVSLYNGYVTVQGQEDADTMSARPGYSEHQTGLAVDVAPADGSCGVQQCFANTPAGKWVAANAYQYGFIVRYPNGKDAVTGYEYEPWHLRYVGVALATEMHKTGITTMEEFFDLPPAPNY